MNAITRPETTKTKAIGSTVVADNSSVLSPAAMAATA